MSVLSTLAAVPEARLQAACFTMLVQLGISDRYEEKNLSNIGDQIAKSVNRL